MSSEELFEQGLETGSVRFVGTTATIGGKGVTVDNLPGFQKNLAALQKQGFFQQGRDTVAVLLDSVKELPLGLRIFDQVHIASEAIPTGMKRVEVAQEIGRALITFLDQGLGSKDPVFFQKGLVSRDDEVKAWLPSVNQPPQGEQPPVVLTDPLAIRKLVQAESMIKPSVRLVALVIAAEGQPGRILIFGIFTIQDYKGRELLLISA